MGCTCVLSLFSAVLTPSRFGIMTDRCLRLPVGWLPPLADCLAPTLVAKLILSFGFPGDCEVLFVSEQIVGWNSTSLLLVQLKLTPQLPESTFNSPSSESLSVSPSEISSSTIFQEFFPSGIPPRRSGFKMISSRLNVLEYTSLVGLLD